MSSAEWSRIGDYVHYHLDEFFLCLCIWMEEAHTYTRTYAFLDGRVDFGLRMIPLACIFGKREA